MTTLWSATSPTDSSPNTLRSEKSAMDIVTPDNFIRAESDLYFGNMVRDGALGALVHFRELTPMDQQRVIRQNRDTLYSAGVFDLDAGPLTVRMPDAGTRFMSMQVITEDHYVPEVVYGPGEHTLTRAEIGTRYVMLGIRTLVDPADPADVQTVHRLQDAIETRQHATGSFEIPEWDPVSQKNVRDALIQLAATLPDTKRAFGTKETTDPVRRLICSASAWGGNPERDAVYLNVVPAHNDGATVYRLTVRDVPVDGFWSVTVYNKDGYFTPNDRDAYSLNNVTAAADDTGAVSIQFGGCDGEAGNCLPITPGWNYMVRLYRPSQQILDGEWTFPEARRVDE